MIVMPFYVQGVGVTCECLCVMSVCSYCMGEGRGEGRRWEQRRQSLDLGFFLLDSSLDDVLQEVESFYVHFVLEESLVV
jgi:hypothetical protein